VSEEIAVSRRLSSGLGIRRAAVFAEPAVTKIEEVVRLVQGDRYEISGQWPVISGQISGQWPVISGQ